jgi:hypothetical protein
MIFFPFVLDLDSGTVDQVFFQTCRSCFFTQIKIYLNFRMKGNCSLISLIKDLYGRKDSNLVFSRFISRGEVLCYNRAKINSFILKCLENS